jgi:uncharacterized repeat protein (TIGR03843 family)
MSARVPTASTALPRPDPAAPDAVCEILRRGTLEISGRLIDASNASFVAVAELAGVTLECVYKPVVGERPLWDFPTGTLAGREVAAYQLSAATSAGVVPPTVFRGDGPLGGGMCQQWIDVDPDAELVDLIGADDDLAGRRPVVQAEDNFGNPVVLVHADDPQLRSMAVFDVVINNADRKGGHVLVERDGRVRGCDHGVCFHEDPKLRTVLWGWSGEPLRDDDVEVLERAAAALDGRSDTYEQLLRLVSDVELAAARSRVRRLLSTAVMPSPAGSWRAIPWPVF